MARLHEYQGKELLKQFKIAVPKGGVARTPEEARRIAEEIGGETMVKAQAWVTGRAGLGGIKKASRSRALSSSRCWSSSGSRSPASSTPG
jgi:succinyl-CoA synthetase beta subunit